MKLWEELLQECWTFVYVTFNNYCCVSTSAFVSLICLPVVITSSAVGLKMCTIVVGIKEYKSIIKNKKNKHDKIVLLGKLDCVEVPISKDLIDSYISHDEVVLVNNVSIEYNEMKEEIKNLETSVEYTI